MDNHNTITLQNNKTGPVVTIILYALYKDTKLLCLKCFQISELYNSLPFRNLQSKALRNIAIVFDFTRGL